MSKHDEEMSKILHGETPIYLGWDDACAILGTTSEKIKEVYEDLCVNGVIIREPNDDLIFSENLIEVARYIDTQEAKILIGLRDDGFYIDTEALEKDPVKRKKALAEIDAILEAQKLRKNNKNFYQ